MHNTYESLLLTIDLIQQHITVTEAQKYNLQFKPSSNTSALHVSHLYLMEHKVLNKNVLTWKKKKKVCVYMYKQKLIIY